MSRPYSQRIFSLALYSITIALTGGSGFAQQSPRQVQRLTLEEARQIALKNNKSLALARMNVTEKQLAVSAARTDYFPKVLGNLTYFRFDQPLGAVNVTAPGTRGIIAPGTPLISTAVVNQDAALGTVFLAQPITKLIAVNAAVQAARADQHIAQSQAEKGERDVVSGVTQLYHGILGARRLQAALELQVKVLDQVLASKPVPELRVALIEAKQGVGQVRGQEQELVAQFLNLLDLPACTLLEMVDPLPPPLPVKCAEDAAVLAVQNNPELREAEQTISKAHAGVKIAKMDFLPDVNVIGGYANQTSASYIQPNIGYVGVSASYTFWGWGKRKYVLHQRQTDVMMANQNLAVAVDKAQAEARKAYIQFEQAAEASQLATEMVAARKAVEKAAAGPALFQAKGDTAKAELEQMKAELTFRIAHAKLAATIGMP